MIVLLAADYADASRWHDSPTRPAGRVVIVFKASDVLPDMIEPNARVVVTDRCTPRPGVVSALQALHQRIGLVDPTGLLGPLDPDRRRPAEGTPPTGAVITGTRTPRRRGDDLGWLT